MINCNNYVLENYLNSNFPFFGRPFERSLPEIEKIFSILQTFDFFKDKIPPKVLRELCVVGVLEQWKEPGFTGE